MTTDGTASPRDAVRAPTMSEVAERAGVSRSLVSTVFRGVPGASAVTRDRVLQAAAELGYRVDRRARLLRSRRTNVVGIVLQPTASFHASLAVALHDRIAGEGRVPSIGLITPAQTLTQAAEAQLGMGAEAVVVIGPANWGDHHVAELERLDRETNLIVVDDPLVSPSFDSIRVDDRAGMELSIGHLVEEGHTRIAYVDGTDQVSGPPRLRAYLDAMSARGLPTHVITGGGLRPNGTRVASEVVEAVRHRGITAIAVYNDETAFGIMDALTTTGIAVPTDLSITGFDDLPEASMPHRQLTTVHQDPFVAADAVAERLHQRLDGAQRVGRILTQPFMTVRASVGAPAR